MSITGIRELEVNSLYVACKMKSLAYRTFASPATIPRSGRGAFYSRLKGGHCSTECPRVIDVLASIDNTRTTEDFLLGV